MSFAIVAGVGAAVSAGMGIAKAIKGSADKERRRKLMMKRKHKWKEIERII